MKTTYSAHFWKKTSLCRNLCITETKCMWNTCRKSGSSFQKFVCGHYKRRSLLRRYHNDVVSDLQENLVDYLGKDTVEVEHWNSEFKLIRDRFEIRKFYSKSWYGVIWGLFTANICCFRRVTHASIATFRNGTVLFEIVRGQMKKCICCFRRIIHTINKIYKLISFAK